MIALDGILVRFGDFVLGPVSLSLETGCYWVLLGPSGSGKSMLLHTLAGAHRLEAGRILIGDRDMTEEPPERRGIGMVFQQSALFPHLSVLENLEYGLRARGVKASEAEERVGEVVRSLRIEGLLSKPVATLSGGEAQMVAIGRAIVVRPALLLLDEPLGPIDHSARLRLQNELRRVHLEFGLTTLHVTHSHEEARALGDRSAVMVGGRLIQAGPTAEVFEAPRCPFIGELLGRGPDSARRPDCTELCRRRAGSCDLNPG